MPLVLSIVLYECKIEQASLTACIVISNFTPHKTTNDKTLKIIILLKIATFKTTSNKIVSKKYMKQK